MKSFYLAAAAVILAASAAQAAPVVQGATGVAPTAGVPAGQGSLLASQSFSGQAFTFAATFNQAVYRNAGGTLDFYYQVLRTGSGSTGNNEIRSFTVNNFDGFLVNGFASAGDPDGGGLFVGANNPNLANGTPSPSTTTFGRSPSGNVLTVEFGANGLTGAEISATYIFRTNAISFDSLGTFGVIDGSTLQGRTYQPLAAAVPEPASWALLMLGFGSIGGMLRRRQNGGRRIRFAPGLVGLMGSLRTDAYSHPSRRSKMCRRR